ncbi:MAG: hypothetical protein Q7U06_01240, partial [Pseudomonadota bacterium]|nr:hypothetical protein [Pseudomonadota bacterium]
FTVVPTTSGPFAGTTLGLFPLTSSFTAVTDITTPAHRATLGDEGTFAVSFVPDALEEAPYAPGMFVAAYALAAYTGDTPTGDALVGMPRYDVLYVSGTIPPEYAGVGIVAGWNALAARGEGDPPEVIATSAIPLDDNLVLRESVTAGGTWGLASGTRIAVVADLDPAIAVTDGGAGAPWTVTVTGRPPPSTVMTREGVTIGGYRPTAYDDTDGSGGWSTDDAVTGIATTADGEPAWLLWGEPATDVGAAHTLVVLGGFRVGWDVGRQDEIAYALPEALWSTLVMDAP